MSFCVGAGQQQLNQSWRLGALRSRYPPRELWEKCPRRQSPGNVAGTFRLHSTEKPQFASAAKTPFLQTVFPRHPRPCRHGASRYERTGHPIGSPDDTRSECRARPFAAKNPAVHLPAGWEFCRFSRLQPAHHRKARSLGIFEEPIRPPPQPCAQYMILNAASHSRPLPWGDAFRPGSFFPVSPAPMELPLVLPGSVGFTRIRPDSAQFTRADTPLDSPKLPPPPTCPLGLPKSV